MNCSVQNKQKRNYSRIAMLLMALFPILTFYKIPLPFSLGESLFIVFSIISIFVLRIRPKLIPCFYILWGYLAINYLIINVPFKITNLLPGGPTFFAWCLAFICCSYLFDIRTLFRYLKIIAIISSIVFLFQELSYLILGYRFCAVLPITSTFTYGHEMTYSELSMLHMTQDRSSSIFMEPSYFAQYLLVPLCFNLFLEKNKVKLVTPFSLFIIFVILLTRSGSGIVGLFLILTIKLIIYIKEKGIGRGLLLIIPLLCFLYVGYIYTATTEAGSQMLERKTELSEENTSGYIRIVKGFIIFEEFPLEKKMFGISMDELSNTSLIFSGNDERLFLNGIQMIMIISGVVALILWIIFYSNIYKKNSLLSKTLILLFLVVSLFESTYLRPLMLILTIVPYAIKYYKDNGLYCKV